jgi:hypothetical protein
VNPGAPLEEGRPWPLGAHWDGSGVNFALFSAHAERVELCLFVGDELQTAFLPERTDQVWHGYLAGVAMMPFGRFAEHVATTPASVLVVRYGGADALRGVPLAEFEQDLAELVRLAQAAHKRVLLAGVIATTSGVTDDFDLAVERTADALGAGFVDVRAVPYALPDDLADGVHPAQAWSDRITAAIVRHLRPLLNP